MIENQFFFNQEVEIPDLSEEYRNNPGRIGIMVKFHESNVHRFMEWLESEGLTICKGAMPQSQEKIKKKYHEYQFERRGLCVPSAS